MKIILWIVIAILWSIPEFFYIVITKEPSKIAQFIANKLNL
jgi:hypothetical protein